MRLFYLSEHRSCFNYQLRYESGFSRYELAAHEEGRIDNDGCFCVLFVLKGEVQVGLGREHTISVHANRMVLIPQRAENRLTGITPAECLLLFWNKEITVCDKMYFDSISHEKPIVTNDHTLPIRKPLLHALRQVLFYLETGLLCRHMHIVTVGGVQETSAKNTLVPNRINVRATVSMVYLSNASSDINATRYAYVSFKYERQIDGEWSDYPNSLNSSMMRAAKIKDINQPVNEENLDKSKNSTYTYGSTYIDIRRPLVLTPTEKANVAKNDTVQRLLSDEWDGNDFYAGLYFGDGSGSYNDYGQTVYLQDKIHIPEIYPTPGFKEGAVFLEIKQGVTTLWGEIDTDQLPDFYKTYAYPSGQDRFTKDPDTGIWKFPEGKLPASDLAKNRAVFIQMRTFVNGTGGTVHTGTVPLSEGGKHFMLTSAYPGNWIGLDIRSRTKGTNQITYSATYEYRSRFTYYLLKEGEQYFLVDFADRTKRIPLEIKECPADWMD